MAETKQKAAHTPGPWIVESQPPGDDSGMVDTPAQVGSQDGLTMVAEACGGLGFSEQFANARLIAAAPDLLEACKTLLSLYTEHVESEYGGTSLLQKLLLKADPARAAIAKAEGGA